MRKRLRFLYRYLFAAHHWRRWITPQILVILILAAGVFLALSLSAKATPVVKSAAIQLQATQQVTPSAPPKPTNTPLPLEYRENASETIGITFAGAVLVLIVVMAVALFMPRESSPPKL